MVVLGGALFCCKPWPALSWTWSLMWDPEKSNPLFLSLFPKSIYRIYISLWPLFLISWIRLNRGMTVNYETLFMGWLSSSAWLSLKKSKCFRNMRWLWLKLSNTSGAFSSLEVSCFWLAVSQNLNKIMSSTLFLPLSSTALDAKVQILSSWFKELYRTLFSLKKKPCKKVRGSLDSFMFSFKL